MPRFVDTAGKSQLGFTFDNGRSPRRQIPETTAGGVGLLDYDGDGWLDVYAVQGGAFPPDTFADRTQAIVYSTTRVTARLSTRPSDPESRG